MIFTYAHLDLPAPTQSIIDAAYNVLDDVAKGKKINDFKPKPGYAEYQHREIIAKDGSKFKTAGTHRFWISKEFDEWVQDYFKQDPANCGISTYDSVGPSLAPHVDTSRNYTIQYLLDLGGNNVDVIWYRENGKPIIRPDLRANYNPSVTINSYENIEEIDRARLALHQWSCLSADILHSVENVEYPRIAIQISRDTPPDNIKWTYISETNTF
jgi:hypothetical protein